MDFRDILKSFDNLSEGEKTVSDKGTVHKSGPGEYGNKHGSEDVKDQYGNRVGRASLSKMDDKPAVKRGKGRPPKNADSSGEVKSYDSSALSKAMGMGKAPKPTGKPSVKHSLKEYFDQMDEALSEAGLAVQPMPATPQQKQQQQMATKPSFMIKDPANPNMPAITTQDPAVVQAAKNGTMSMQKPGAAPTAPGATPAAGAGSQVKPMEEDGENWIKGAIKHPGAFTKKASSHGMTPKEFANKVLAHKKDYPAKTEKQAQLAKTLGKMHEAEAPQHFAQSSPLSTANRGVLEGSVAKQGFIILDPKLMAQIEPMDGTEVENDVVWSNNPNITAKLMAFAQKNPQRLKVSSSQSDTGGARPAGNQFSQAAGPELVEGKKGVNPFAKKDTKKKPDADKDGVPDWADKKPGKDDNEGKKKGAAPKKGVNPFAKKTEKKKVKEGMEHSLQAARLEGKSHALRKMPYNCTHDDMEEARCYHDGFKEGLDECYGQMPILGRTAVGEMGQGPEVDTMASYGADDMGMDEGNAFTAGLAKTPHGGKFKVGGSTFTDRTSYDSNLDEFAFEALDKQLNALLESEEKVSEGMTVSISKGQQGSPDSVSVSAQDGEADQLLSIIKSAGMGLFGGDEQNGYGAPQGSAGAHGGISVVDDHDGMMALMKKLSGNGGDMSGGSDYESEEGHEGHGEEDHSHEGEEETCNECGGMMEENHQCGSGQQVVDEVESEDQMEFEVAENAPDSGADNTNAEVADQVGSDEALAKVDGEQDMASPTNEAEDETGEEAGKKKEETVAESFANLYKKLAFLSEESIDKEEDEKAEKAGKKVAKDIEYDEGHKGKDDNKAEKAGKKVTKDIEYDDKKDKKKIDEWANEAGKNGTDAAFETDIDFMTKVISGGLNKQKSTGQTTIPVINGQNSRMGVDGLGSPMKESTDLLKDYMRLSGL